MINVFLLLKEELPILRIKQRFEVLPGAKVGFNTEKETMYPGCVERKRLHYVRIQFLLQKDYKTVDSLMFK